MGIILQFVSRISFLSCMYESLWILKFEMIVAKGTYDFSTPQVSHKPALNSCAHKKIKLQKKQRELKGDIAHNN